MYIVGGQYKSRFVKIAPSTFGLNLNYKQEKSKQETKIEEKFYKISKLIRAGQKGQIAEGRIAELITPYGDEHLSCYKPISDDEGIELIVKERNSFKSIYLQIKSNFGSKYKTPFVSNMKVSNVKEHYASFMVFCFFDEDEGDIWDYLWFIPTPEFVKQARIVRTKKRGELYNFVAGRSKRETNIWDKYLFDKRDLANQIIAQMKRI